jgi:hypothetical protein
MKNMMKMMASGYNPSPSYKKIFKKLLTNYNIYDIINTTKEVNKND